MESADLARWQRFASKGGIGKSTALIDRIAEHDGDLMFLKDDEIIVLMQLPQAGYYLGFCEGVVGRFAISDVQVHGKLKRAVMARRPASGNPASPNPSPIALATAPSPIVPHTTTLFPLRASVNESRVPDPHPSDNGTGVSAWLASQPSPPHENVPITETEPEPAASRRTESISLPHPSSPLDPKGSPLHENDTASSLRPTKSQDASPPSSPSSSSRNRPPLHVDTSPLPSAPQRESQSLASLVSTEASPLSDTSAYSFHQRPGSTEIRRETENGGKVPQFQSQANVRRSEAGSIQEFTSSYRQTSNDAETESRIDMESSVSRASTPSVGDPFQHDQPSTSSQLSSPTQFRVPPRNANDGIHPDATGSSFTSAEMIKTPHHAGEELRDGTTAPDTGRVVSASISDAGAGIGLSLLGGLLGAGGGDSDSESDYGQPSEDEADAPRKSRGEQESRMGDKEARDVSIHRTNSMIRQPRSGDVTPLGTGSITPLNGGLSASQSPSLSNSRSSTPPFGFELDPTTNLSQGPGASDEATGKLLANDLKAPIDEAKSVLAGSTPSSPAKGSRDTHTETRSAHPTEEGGSDDESDYGEEVQPSGSGSQIPPSSSDAFPRYSNESMQQFDDDNDFDLPPVRPPYHRASTSIRSITSSDAGGYYDDAIYDHYRYSQISMAARSVRMSVIGAEEIPPLPSGGDIEHEPGIAERRDRQFAPLNLSPKSGPQGSLSSPSSQIQFSPGLNGPKSPSVRSPLGQGEPASPRSIVTNTSPLAAGPILQAQMATRGNTDEINSDEIEGRQTDKNGPPLSLKTTGLPTAPTPAMVGTLITSPGGLGLPLSPTAPGSPLSSNLASTLRQVIEQQRTPEPGLQAPLQAEIVNQEEPVLGSPAAINNPQQGYSAYEPSPIASLQRRPSRFAPHPNAPKPSQMFATNAPPAPHLIPQQEGSNNQPPTGPQHMRLHDALTMVVQRLRTNGMAGGAPTIHGRTHSELSQSWTPVPISFVFDPDGRSIPMFNRPALVPQRMIGGAQRSASMNVQSGPNAGIPANGGEYVGSKLRPRSRSFSDVPNEQLATYKVTGEQSMPQTPTEPNRPRRASGATPATHSPLVQPPTPGPAQGQTSPIKSLVGADTPLRSPMSPPTSPIKQVAPQLPNAPSSSTSKSPFRGLRQVASNTMMRVGLQSSISSMPTRQSSDNLHHSPVDSQRKPSEDMSRPNASLTNISSPTSPSTSPMASSHVSLNSKISSTGLRLTGASRPATDTPTTPLSPIASVEPTEETVHYNDMDFDMVKPMRSRLSIVRTSEDGRQSVSRSSQHSDHPKIHQDDEHEHSPTSPVVTLPSNQTHVPSTPTPTGKAGSHNSLTTSDSIAAHISREQRWISTMQAVPSSTVRRNKKVKKLLLEGVPTSVRGVVWLYLTDSKARRMIGVYSQLAKRGKVPATPEIMKDAEICFSVQPHLQSPNGPVVSILQAYLTMVPDVTYSQGLCQVAGNLLMHSPEEDAFWTFVALMDKHLRGYCATNSLQMEADSVFFSKTLESNDPQLATKLFRELGLLAGDFCKPWLLSGFIGVVPFEYSSRIWDIFLFEGATFLFRVGLVLLGYLRKQIMTLTPKSSPGVLDCLLSISSQVLPADPDQLIASAYAVRFKDDDMRKMRPKIESQLRKEPGFTRPALSRDALRK
ncbi:TBC1 domain family member 10B OS=Mus musculus GN=Tbc1d10b PE=1 SV=2 [Rhizoctonia solani AG-1 IB]|uniref:TBC1 domain family member 10B n=1 Tax=Thanatephorus cucumeris (strain AG1-IB / isolate 7/3/14) TaxID=1108050 RepID=A0A0B7FS73_THACB|nr:TBC1 domain family member 10B OS=Mus musculus GN=Tbc1d10b PE=1 SV=2 [Rhizoctonia solani AG-1 IB]